MIRSALALFFAILGSFASCEHHPSSYVRASEGLIRVYHYNDASHQTAELIQRGRSGTVLVTSTEYHTAEEAFQVTDPAGRERRTTFDAAGRVTQTIDNYVHGNPSTGGSDQDVTVDMAYNAAGGLITLTAKNPTTGDQVTRYVYAADLGSGTPSREEDWTLDMTGNWSAMNAQKQTSVSMSRETTPTIPIQAVSSNIRAVIAPSKSPAAHNRDVSPLRMPPACPGDRYAPYYKRTRPQFSPSRPRPARRRAGQW